MDLVEWKYPILKDDLEAMIAEAQSGRMVIHHNSLLGAFVWTPDEFQHEIDNGKFRFSRENFHLETADWYRARLEREEAAMNASLNQVKSHRAKFDAWMAKS